MELPYLGLLTRKPSLELYARFIMLLTIKQKNNNQLKLVICNLRPPTAKVDIGSPGSSSYTNFLGSAHDGRCIAFNGDTVPAPGWLGQRTNY